MNHSNDLDSRKFAVTCYLDESGTHDDSQHAVVAGLLLNKTNFLSFSEKWLEILNWWRIDSPLHMKEFGRPHGRFASLTDEQRYAIFAEIAALINSHKIISIAATINQNQFREICKFHKKKEMSSYGMCFILCAYLNHRQAEYMKYDKDIAIIIERTSEHRGHILAAYDVIMEWQKTKPFHMGSLNINGDKSIPALQAADIIAWGVRRRLMGEPFDKGFEFIETILDDKIHHVQSPWQDIFLKNLAQEILKYKQEN